MATFQSFFDYQDVSSIELIKIINENAILSEVEAIKKFYKYDYILQVNLFTINGLTCNLTENDQKVPIANVFLKFSHRDLDGMVLTNKNEKKIVLEVKSKI